MRWKEKRLLTRDYAFIVLLFSIQRHRQYPRTTNREYELTVFEFLPNKGALAPSENTGTSISYKLGCDIVTELFYNIIIIYQV